MNRIEKLIKEKCPNGVEFTKLEYVSEIIQGFAFKNSTFKKTGIGVLRTTNIQDGFVSETGMVYIDPVDYKNDLTNFLVKKNNILIGMSGSIKVGINTNNTEYYLNQRVSMLKPKDNILNNFLYHYLKETIEDLINTTSGSSVKNLSVSSLKKHKIPIPPLEIQEEIVNILDKFSQLEAELEAELELRVKQYEFWREYLLFRNKTEKFKLKKFAKYSTDRVNNEAFEESDFVSVENLLQDKKGVRKYERSLSPGNYTLFEKEDTLIGNIRPYLRKIWFSDKTAGTNGDVLVIQNNKPEVILNKYLYYILSSEKFFQYNIQHSKGAKMPRGDKKKIMEFKFPLDYPLKEQQNIVDILDKFDNLINHIKEGIPAEIELRKKQYEYYRNKLLIFDELKTN